VERERDGSIAGRMSLVHATPARTGYVACTSKRAFTQGNECMNERGIDRLPVCFSVRWIRRSHSFFFPNTYFFFQRMLQLFFQPEGKIRYRTRRIIASVFLIYRLASLYVMRYTFFFWRAVILAHSCKSVQSIYVRVCTQLLRIQEYMQSACFFL
jgi:hypothetical protein